MSSSTKAENIEYLDFGSTSRKPKNSFRFQARFLDFLKKLEIDNTLQKLSTSAWLQTF